ncbi:MAG TPA: polyphosphate kinase [Myxococcales bacterium]|nr:polyphosphate kinase [Myxococcales bacterium]
MGAKRGPLSELLHRGDAPVAKTGHAYDQALADLDLRMLRIQQGLWHRKRRAVVAFEGFDAAGKGGAIRRLVGGLDPRSVNVWPIGPPRPDEQGRHYLYRFWARLPVPGTIAVFDRSWYGRVLVERVEKLAPREAWRRAYREINEFERALVDDGVDVVKIFLAIDAKEQLRRLEARLRDPYKQWKLTEDDLRARARWDAYVEAADEMLDRTSKKRRRWHLVAANDKPYARRRVLELVTRELGQHHDWMEDAAEKSRRRSLRRELAALRGIG